PAPLREQLAGEAVGFPGVPAPDQRGELFGPVRQQVALDRARHPRPARRLRAFLPPEGADEGADVHVRAGEAAVLLVFGLDLGGIAHGGAWPVARVAASPAILRPARRAGRRAAASPAPP